MGKLQTVKRIHCVDKKNFGRLSSLSPSIINLVDFTTVAVPTMAVMLTAVMLLPLSGIVYAEATDTHTIEGGVEIQISYPDSLVAGREGIVSILVKNNGWENKQDISFDVSLSDEKVITTDPAHTLQIGNLAEGGAYGKSISMHIANNSSPGTHYLNLRYTHVLVANNETPQEPFFYDIAIPVKIKKDASISIRTQTPESIFANAEFPITVEVMSKDIDLRDVQIRIIPPLDITFRGETLHTFSKIEKQTPISITSWIITPAEQVSTDHSLPFEIVIKYVDDIGEEKTDAQTVSVILRPRMFMELTVDGGIWLGNIFIAPYISIGTIAGIPAGAIISILLKKKFSGQTRRKRR